MKKKIQSDKWTHICTFEYTRTKTEWGCLISGLPCGSDSKEFARNAGDLGLIPALGRSPGEGHGNPLQYSCSENPHGRGAWWATVHTVTKRHDWAINYIFLNKVLNYWVPVSNFWWRRKWKPTPVFLPGESHGQRNLPGYSPWGRKESDLTEVTTSLVMLPVITIIRNIMGSNSCPRSDNREPSLRLWAREWLWGRRDERKGSHASDLGDKLFCSTS